MRINVIAENGHKQSKRQLQTRMIIIVTITNDVSPQTNAIINFSTDYYG